MTWFIIFLIFWIAISTFLFIKKQNALISIGGSLILALILFLITHGIFGPAPPPPTPEEIAAKQERSEELDARTWAKIYVEKSLKAPKTAEFQNTLDFEVEHIKGDKKNPQKNLWKVAGYVDAQNSFGAMLRNRFYIELVKLDDKWIPVKIIVN